MLKASDRTLSETSLLTSPTKRRNHSGRAEGQRNVLLMGYKLHTRIPFEQRLVFPSLAASTPDHGGALAFPTAGSNEMTPCTTASTFLDDSGTRNVGASLLVHADVVFVGVGGQDGACRLRRARIWVCGRVEGVGRRHYESPKSELESKGEEPSGCTCLFTFVWSRQLNRSSIEGQESTNSTLRCRSRR